MRFFTIFFMLVYGWRLFSKQGSFVSLCNKVCEGKTGEEVTNQIKVGLKEGDGDTIMLVFMTACMFISLIIQIFYVLFALKYCNILIWALYVAFIVLNRIITKIKHSVNKTNVSKPMKYTARTFLMHSVNLIFFVYMFFILFIL